MFWRSEPHGLTDRARFLVRKQSLQLGHCTSDQILERSVALEAAAVLPDPHQPRPHVFRWCVAGEGVRDLAMGGDPVVAGQNRAQFGIRYAPTKMPRAQKKSVNDDQYRQHRGDNLQAGDEPAFQASKCGFLAVYGRSGGLSVICRFGVFEEFRFGNRSIGIEHSPSKLDNSPLT